MSDQPAQTSGDTTLRLRYETIEAHRQAILVYLGNGVAGAFLLAFGLANLLEDRHTLGWFSVIHGCIPLVNIVLFRLTGNFNWPSYGFAYGLLVMFTFLLCTGGVDGTGPLWGYPMAAVAISILHARRGMAVVVTMCAITLILFLAPPPFVEVAPYSADFKIRFSASFLALALFIGLHEYARARSQDELLRVSAQIDRLSQTDVLTDLPNRRFMMERLEEENSRFLRHRHPYAILYGDVDDFKQINDRHGHQAGDEALRAIAQTLRANLRQHDLVCRWGGEEFLVLLPETGAEMALEVAEKLRTAIAAIDFRPGGGAAQRLTMSFGLQAVASEGSIDSFIQQADRKLYRAKAAGKNRAVAELAES